MSTPSKDSTNSTKSVEESKPVPEQKENPHDYQNLDTHFNKGTGGWLSHNGYTATILPDNEGFIAFGPQHSVMGQNPSPIGGRFEHYGLKFHVSLPETNRGQYELGWSIVRNILMERGVFFKIVRPGVQMSDTPEQRGKDVTIYASYNPEKTLREWQWILQEITAKLTAAEVSPGYRSPGTHEKPELPVDGSNYITYRYFNENHEDRGWPPAHLDRAPLIGVRVQNQPPIPAWTPPTDGSTLTDSATHTK